MISPLLKRQFRATSSRINILNQGSRRAASFSSYLPNLNGVSSSTTLGELFSRLYTNYRYRLVWPIAGWIGFLYLTLWEDYAPASKRAEQLKRMELLKSLEFSQE